jgi:uncharacterized protein (DUF58 family)
MIIREVWLGIAALLLLVGIGIREPAVAALGALVLFAGGLSRLWSRLSLERLEYRRSLPEHRAFVGEAIEVHYSLANRKALPLPWVEVREYVPDTLPALDAHAAPSARPGSLQIDRSTSLTWYERVSWRHRFLCRQRGYYPFGPALLRSGDVFGLFPVEREAPARHHVTVLPRLADLPELGLPTERPFGEARSGSRLFEDPSRILGVRDYRPGDPLKRIDWKATARRRALQSRVYEPSASLYLLLALNVDTFAQSWEGYDPVLLERAITVAGSVARWADTQRYAVGLVANASMPGADRPITVPPGRDPEQLTRVLEALAMVAPFTIAPLAAILEEAARHLPMGASVAAVAGFPSEGLIARLERMARRGHPTALLWVGDDPPPPCERVRLHELTTPMRRIEREWLAAGERRHRPREFAPPADEQRAFAPPEPVAGTERDEHDPVRRWARPR